MYDQTSQNNFSWNFLCVNILFIFNIGIRLNFDKKCRPFSFLIALYLPVYLILYLYFLIPIPQLQYVHIPSPLVSTYTLPIGGLIKW